MSDVEKKNLIVILGPTASGKTSLAVGLAVEFDGEIISADSRQVYRGMDLGTGKDLSEYLVGGRAIPYHMIDIIDPEDEFNLFQFQKRFAASFDEISERGKIPILVGGTGMYLESVISEYELIEAPEDPEWRKNLDNLEMDALVQLYQSQERTLHHNKTDMTNRNRLIRAIEIARQNPDRKALDESRKDALKRVDPFIIGVRLDRSVLRQRITERLNNRLQSGLIEEVMRLKERGLSWARLDAFGLEYRYIAQYLQGRLSYDEMFRTLETKIHQFAKRQDTWFRRMERRGIAIHWVEGPDPRESKRLVRMALQR